MITLDSTDSEILAEMRKIRELYQLKRTLRYGSSRDHTVHSESVAEHLFGMLTLAEYFYPLEDPTNTLNRADIIQLTLYHDVGEIDTGDLLFHLKGADEMEREQQAVRAIVQRLPESLRNIVAQRSAEFEECSTREAQYVRAIDRIEPLFELLDNDMLSYRRLGITAEIAIEKKRYATDNFPYMRRFLDAWMKHAIAEDIFAK